MKSNKNVDTIYKMKSNKVMIKDIMNMIKIWFSSDYKNDFILKNEDYDGFISINKLIKRSSLGKYSEKLCLISFKTIIASNLHFLEFSLDRNRVRKLIN